MIYIGNKEKLENAKRERIGQEIINTQGLKMKILEYHNNKNVDLIIFDETATGYIVKGALYKTFKNGNIKSPYFKSMFGIGYIGEGKYKSTKDRDKTFIYDKWADMFRRCYGDHIKNNHSYVGYSVDKRWHNFQNFAKWFDENIWSSDCLFLDKDIINKGNKVYSEENCVIVDNRINCLFTKNDVNRGEFPIGVYLKKDFNKYVAQCSVYVNDEIKYRQKFLGYYNTSIDAFNSYKKFKENYIKQVADEYRIKYPNFPDKLYQAMYNYQVEITD